MDKFGFIRVAAAVPNVKVADIKFNIEEICRQISLASSQGVDLLILPELCVTGYTCGDLFEQPLLIDHAKEAVENLVGAECFGQTVVALGAPLMIEGRHFNCAIVMDKYGILGVVPKIHLPNYGEFYEKRWFESGATLNPTIITLGGEEVPVGNNLLFTVKGVKFGVEICEDLWVPVPPSSDMARAGAELIGNLSASDELIGKHDYLLRLIAQQSGRLRCGYIYASAGWGESSTDLVFAGNVIIAEDGNILDSKRRFFTKQMIAVKDIDIERLRSDRARFSTFYDGAEKVKDYKVIDSSTRIQYNDDLMNVRIDPYPFVPGDRGKLNAHCEEIISIQARGLMQRLNAIGCRNAVIGISGGLDSTLALLVTVKAFDLLGIDRKGIHGITMPGLATTSRTRSNAMGLMEELGITAIEIPIGKAVAQHFADIGQDPEKYDVTYENSQARERTQILMDYSNKVNGIVIGTGDMSELALGWCTYNGDHMSMYGVNASVPKTLVKHLVKWFAGELDPNASKILLDIVDTPISPELVPSDEADEIGQKTEDLVGPYALHDFFLYHLLRNSFSPSKIFMLAGKAFGSTYSDKTILKWLRNFYRRFFSQQFKRSCMPDGPKVGSVNLSPRGDWRMPSDASAKLWLEEVDAIKLS